MRSRYAIACAALAMVMTTLPGVAYGSHAAFEQVSVGAVGGNAALPSQFVGTNADGTRAFLRTEESLSASDTDTEFDLYERAGGVTTHMSIGPSGGNAEGLGTAILQGMSTDGKRVFFQIPENLVPGDTDECQPDDPNPNPCSDVYEYSAGNVTLVSTGPAGGNGAFGARYLAASEDGTRVTFTTEEQLTAGDTDAEFDIYQRSGGTTTLVSTGTAGGNGSFDAFFRGASADGTVVFFTTSEQLLSGDTDSVADVYQRSSGGTSTLVSTGPAGGNGGAGAAFEGTPRSGAKAYFSTSEQLVGADTDSSRDVYERSGGTTTLVSTGPAGGNGARDAEFRVVSDGGTRVLFETAESLVSSDTDSALDVYERSGGTTTLLSTGPTGGNGSTDSMFQGASADASRIVFGTTEAMVASDTDGMFDLYERTGGTTTLVSTGPSGGNGAFEAFFSAISTDGSRIIFETQEQLSSDTDTMPDVYERAGGVTTRLSTGTGGGNGEFVAVFLAASDDGSRVFFNTAEALAGTDTDTASDVYVARTTASYVRPKAASPTELALVPAYRQCTAPNRAHGPPMLGGGAFDPSCAPPVQTSSFLTVGTFDANQQPSKAIGKIRYQVQIGTPSTPADEADVKLHMEMSDVRRQGTLDDYNGQLTASTQVKITDRENGSVVGDPATVVELPFDFVAACAATADTTVGGTCAVDTTADAVLPGAIKEGFRSSWELKRAEVYDGGADGDATTPGNTLLAVQGLFVP